MNGKAVTTGEIKRLQVLLGMGYGPAESARRMGITEARAHGIIRLHIPLPSKYTLLTDLALEVGVTAFMLRNHAQRGILPARKWAGRLVYTREQADAVRAYYAEHAQPDTPWLTAAQTARELGCEATRLHRVRDRMAERYGVTIRRKKLRGVSGNVWRYHPEDVARAAKCEPRLFRGRPRDHVSTKVLADMAGLLTTGPAVTWAQKGCPHVRDHLRRLWFRPSDVLAWLHTRPPHRLTRDAIARLSAALELERAA